LEAIYAVNEMWDELYALYSQRAASIAEVPDSPQFLAKEHVYWMRKAGFVNEHKIGNLEEAFEMYQYAWLADFTDNEAVAELENVARQLDRCEILAHLAGEIIAADQAQPNLTPDDRTAIYLALGRWYGQELDQHEWAVQCYQAVKRYDPHNVDAVRHMAQLYRKLED